ANRYRPAVSTIALDIEGLSKSFGEHSLFSGLTFRVDTGLTAVQGRNGSGKTTLVKILASLLRPSGGTVRVRQAERELSGDEKRLAIGWAGLDLAFYEDFSARENLIFFRRAAGRTALREEVDRLLAEVGLEAAANQRVGVYSTGMKQRLRLAFAL